MVDVIKLLLQTLQLGKISQAVCLWPKKVAAGKHSSLLCPAVSVEEKSLITLTPAVDEPQLEAIESASTSPLAVEEEEEEEVREEPIL